MKCLAFTLLIIGLACPLNGQQEASAADGGFLADVAGRVPIEVQLGAPEVLLKDGQLGLRYFPDGAVSVLAPTSQSPFRMILPVGNRTYLVEGQSLDRLTQGAEVLTPGKAGEFDNGYAGISSVYNGGNGKLYGFYHAEDHQDMPAIGGGVPGFFCSVGAAVSEDEGRSWRKLGQVITSAKPKNWTAFPDQPDRGAGEVSVVPSHDRKYLLAYYTEHSRMENRGVQICMARTDISSKPPLPGTWRKYRDNHFDQPGIGGLDTPILSASHLDDADAVFPQVSYSEYLGLYVMVFNINVWKEYADKGRAQKKSGIYVAYSADAITWSEPQMLVKDYAVCQTGKSVSWHPTIVWGDVEHRQGWLVYSHSERWGHVLQGGTPHYMVGRRIRFMRPKASPTRESVVKEFSAA